MVKAFVETQTDIQAVNIPVLKIHKQIYCCRLADWFN